MVLNVKNTAGNYSAVTMPFGRIPIYIFSYGANIYNWDTALIASAI